MSLNAQSSPAEVYDQVRAWLAITSAGKRRASAENIAAVPGVAGGNIAAMFAGATQLDQVDTSAFDDAAIAAASRFALRSPSTFAGRAIKPTAIDVYEAVFTSGRSIDLSNYAWRTQLVNLLHPWVYTVGETIGTVGAPGDPYPPGRNMILELNSRGVVAIEDWRGLAETDTNGVEVFFQELDDAIDRDITFWCNAQGVTPAEVEIAYLEGEILAPWTKFLYPLNPLPNPETLKDTAALVALEDILKKSRESEVTGLSPVALREYARQIYLQLATRFYRAILAKIRQRMPQALACYYSVPYQRNRDVMPRSTDPAWTAATNAARDQWRDVHLIGEGVPVLAGYDLAGFGVYQVSTSYGVDPGDNNFGGPVTSAWKDEYIARSFADAEAFAAASGMALCPFLNGQYTPTQPADPYTESANVSEEDLQRMLDATYASSARRAVWFGDWSSPAGALLATDFKNRISDEFAQRNYYPA